MNKFDSIALKHGTDKASSHHAYMSIYESLLSNRKIDRLLELGVSHGKSHFMWTELFPDALIVGIDNNPWCRLHQRKNIAIIIADGADPAMLSAVSTLHGPFDVIIDDLSHELDEVNRSFGELWWRLAPGGVYIIEDLDGEEHWVVEFVKRWNGKFICAVEDKLNYAKKPGLIVVEKLA